MARNAPKLIALAALLALASPSGLADPAAESAEPLEAQVELVVPEGAAAGPGFDVERATTAWVETLSPEKRARSDAYFEGGYWLALFSFLYGLGVAWVFLGLRVSAWMRDRAEAAVQGPTAQSAVCTLDVSGKRRRTARVTTPSVPSLPTKTCFTS